MDLKEIIKELTDKWTVTQLSDLKKLLNGVGIKFNALSIKFADVYEPNISKLSQAIQSEIDSRKNKFPRDQWKELNNVVLDIQEITSGRWNWVKNTRCKYINIRIDTRDGYAIICDRDGKVITLEQLRYQYSSKE